MTRKNIIRYSADFDALERHFKAAGRNETQLFTLFSRAASRRCNIFIANMHILPDRKELRNQSPALIEPTREFQAIAYGLVYETGKIVGDQHNHPFTTKPWFSSIDNYHGRKNALYLSKYLPGSATTIMVVFVERLRYFQSLPVLLSTTSAMTYNAFFASK